MRLMIKFLTHKINEQKYQKIEQNFYKLFKCKEEHRCELHSSSLQEKGESKSAKLLKKTKIILTKRIEKNSLLKKQIQKNRNRKSLFQKTKFLGVILR